MKCAFCESDKDNVKMGNALAEVGGLVRLPACPVDQTWLADTFSNPLSTTQLVRMQKAVL